jgi:class 3 adenylate cyclase
VRPMRFFLVCLVMGFFAKPVWADLGRYEIPYQKVIRPQLNLPASAERRLELRALAEFLKRQDLSDELLYTARRQFLLYAEFEDHEAFQRVKTQFQPRPDDYLLLTTFTMYDRSLDYLPKVSRLENFFELAQKTEPGSEIAGWIAHDALGLMTDHFDFGRASNFVSKAIAVLPEKSWLLRSQLLSAIARLYVDPGNSLAIVRQGLAIYAENESRMRSRGMAAEASDMAYNQGIAMLFAFQDHKKSLEHFRRVDKDTLYAQDALVFSALAHSHLGQYSEAREKLGLLDFSQYAESPMRLSFLACYTEIVKQRLGETADLQRCVQLPEATQGDVIQNMTSEILQLGLTPALEMAILKQFQNFYQLKISPQIKLRMAQSVDGLELARARAESDRNRLENRISRMELDLAQKQSEMTFYGSAGLLIVLALIIFGLWRRQVESHRLQKLQQYLQTRILSRFLPPALVEEIRLGRSRLDEEPQKRVVTILFADLVDFTAKAEQLGTDRTARILNQWMHMATDIVFAENGTIDKFIGDCVMVLFGAPLDLTPEAQIGRAVACAQDLLRAMEEKNDAWLRDFGVSFELRIGINQGEAIVGSFGSEKRSDYTVIGGAVNLASRIENMANPGQILLSQSAARHLSDHAVRALGSRPVRGMKESQEIFELQHESVSAAV